MPPPVAEQETKDTEAGKLSVTTTLFAVLGPLLLTLNVNVTVELDVTTPIDEDFVIDRSAFEMILNVNSLDVPPPGGGLKTVIFAVPSAVMSDDGIVAISMVELTNTVALSLPFQRTLELLTKFVPVMVNVKPGLPAMIVFGLKLLRLGTGFCCGLIVKAN